MLVAGLQILHVFGFIFLIAPLLLIALRVVAGALRDQPLDSIVGPCLRLSGLGLALSLGSGGLMFLSAPLHYYDNWAFGLKMLILVAALFTSAVFIAAATRDASRPRLPAQIAISLSVVLWVLVCMAGRAIGFV